MYICMYVYIWKQTTCLDMVTNPTNDEILLKKKILQAGLRNKIVLMQYTVCCLFEMIHDRALSN